MPLTYLTGVINNATDSVKHYHGHDVPLGMLVQPLTAHYLDKAGLYNWVGIDNGCFSEVGRRKFRLNDYLGMIEYALKVGRTDSILFATAPDVPFDWEATLAKSLPVLSKITALGINFQKRNEPPLSAEREAMFARMGKSPWYNIAAICIQDGATVETVPWDLIGTIFIGGSTEWKLGPMAHKITLEAHKRSKHVHMGRVNSMKRMLICQEWGVDTADGTYLLYTAPQEGTFDITEWLRENWRRYVCNFCGIRNTHCICGKVDYLTREEIDARYAIPDGMNPRKVKEFIRGYVANTTRKI